MSKKFTHLHLHTEYSLRDAITSPEELMRKCAESSMTHVAVTDHGNLMGMHKSKVYADKYGINLIPGNEMYVVPDIDKCRGKSWMRGKSSHLVLLAKDNRGWENLKLLTTKSNKLGYYSEPRVDYNMLREHSAQDVKSCWQVLPLVDNEVGGDWRDAMIQSPINLVPVEFPAVIRHRGRARTKFIPPVFPEPAVKGPDMAIRNLEFAFSCIHILLE